MTNKFRNKYRIPSSCAQWCDYGKGGAYYITICTAHRHPFFGHICDGKMHETPIGELARKYWLTIPDHFPFVTLDAFVIMPDHIHGIIVNNPPVETPNMGVSDNMGISDNLCVSARWKPGSLGVIINQYKRICTINARKIDPHFAWQSRFYDHIIRDREDWQRIALILLTNYKHLLFE